MSADVKRWQDRMTESGRRECESLALELAEAEIADLRTALADKPLGPTIAELQAAGALPAFPSHGTMGEVVQPGMTLRDYFAGKALQGLIGGRSWAHTGDADLMALWAAGAYATADAMLAARGAA